MLSHTLGLLVLAGSAAVMAAPLAPPETPPSFGDKLGITASGPGINHVEVTASKGQIFVGGRQAPKCEDGQRQDFATFILHPDHTLFLSTPAGVPPQQLWVDRSGMGKGVSGYTSRDQKLPRNGERAAFLLTDKDGFLNFEGTGTKACPTPEAGKWSIWFTESPKPAFQDGCVDVKLKAYKAPARVACEYSAST